MSVIRYIILLTLFVSSIVNAYEIKISKEMEERAHKAAGSDMKESVQANKSMAKIKNILDGVEWKAKSNQYRTEISKTLKLEIPGEGERDGDLKVSPDRPVLFISRSIPVNTLRQYAIDLAKVGGVMVLQGGVEGLKNLGPTMKFTADILKVDQSCKQNCKMRNTPVLIDPILFRSNQIKVVPALIYQRNLNMESHCSDGGMPPSASYVAYGDASLRGLLEALYEMSSDVAVNTLIEAL